jgi:glycosyltransferase involved in cell wall biosynthesis
VAFAPYDPSAPAALRAQADAADVVMVQGFTLHSYPFLTRLVAPIVVDLYCPFTLEHLEQARGARPPDDPGLLSEARAILEVQNAQLQHGDLFLAASGRQRDFWTGALHTAGRVNPRTLAHDPALTDLVRVVPFGLPDMSVADFDAPARARRVAAGRPAGVLKGVHPAIGAHDKVLLWGGSLLDWQDPEMLIEAVALLTAERPDIRLFFMGVRHPNPQVAPMTVVQRCRDLAQARGLLDTHVIFNDWVPYEERGAYLMEADLGVSTHQAHLETRYAFRTRMLDYIWARLPIVCTEGDHFGELVRERGLGRSVPPVDPRALAHAITTLLDDPAASAAARAALEVAAREMTWSKVVEPLAAYCAAPAFAGDRADRVERFHAALARSFQGTRLLKRTLLRLGVGEGRIESVKRLSAVRAMMTLRNRAAIWRARQRSEQA